MEMMFLGLNRTIQDLTKMLHRLIGEDISLSTDLDPELWTIKGDAGTMEQTITNLVVNARDAMPYGGKIAIETHNVCLDEEYCCLNKKSRPGEFISLSVRDTGEGMNRAVIERIFDPFFTTKELGKGTGMGLSVVYGIVKKHDGWIDVESSPGNGTVFNIYLPAVSMKAEEIQKTPAPVEPIRGKGERVLLVEDEEAVRRLVSKALSRNGYVVFAAANAKEAMDIFQKEEGNFDLVFTDVILPGERGPEFVKRLLKVKPGMKVLFTSGYSDEKSDWHTIREGGHLFLQKPYSLSDLFRIVRTTLKG
ncbi:MAG: response regulator [Proteobacteria bacterium]|nr:response regulator [Pseudomonadota bacterium]